MRITLAGDSMTERIAILANQAPAPVGFAMYGMPMARVVGVAQRLGLFQMLLRDPASAAELAREMSLTEPGTRLLCDCLAGLGVLERDGERFSLDGRARRWLDPESETYVGTFIEHTLTFWEWWGDLERVVRGGESFEIHRVPAEDDAYWRLYITGQYELARLSAREVAGAIRLPDEPAAVLDLAGGHGWFAAALCQRHPTLRATVLDLPGSARVGREIIAAAGMADRVEHREGDMFQADLGGPYDGALLFDILHHLSPEQAVTVLRRVREALRPGGTVAVLDMFHSEGARQTASAAALGLFFHLTSGADLPRPDALAGWLAESGFERPRRTRIRRIPDQDLYQAAAL